MAPFFVDTSHERTPAAMGSLPGSSEVADFSSPITFRLSDTSKPLGPVTAISCSLDGWHILADNDHLYVRKGD